jgi:hypothetical protein
MFLERAVRISGAGVKQRQEGSTIAGALRGHERGRRHGDKSGEDVACEHREECCGEEGVKKMRVVKGERRKVKLRMKDASTRLLCARMGDPVVPYGTSRGLSCIPCIAHWARSWRRCNEPRSGAPHQLMRETAHINSASPLLKPAAERDVSRCSAI